MNDRRTSDTQTKPSTEEQPNEDQLTDSFQMLL